MGTSNFDARGNPSMDWYPIQGGVEIFLVASCYRNRYNLLPDGPLGLYADFAYLNYNKLDHVLWSSKNKFSIVLNYPNTETQFLALRIWYYIISDNYVYSPHLSG